MRTRRPDHLRSFDYLGLHRYFLTFCVADRRRAFLTQQHFDVVFAQILRSAEHERFALIAYCFMPDHVHLLAEGTTDVSDCLRFVSLAKQLSGYHYQKVFGSRLWQKYGYERTLRHDETSLSVARYIVENPIRARFVERAADYPFLGSMVYTIEQILDAIQLRDDRGFRSA
jgi:putative transposase